MVRPPAQLTTSTSHSSNSGWSTRTNSRPTRSCARPSTWCAVEPPSLLYSALDQFTLTKIRQNHYVERSMSHPYMKQRQITGSD